MKVDKKKSAKIIKNTAMVMSVAFAGLYFISKKKKDSTIYENEPEQKNSLEGKKVVFVEDENNAENADGVKGHLEAVGVSDYKPGLYEKYIKRMLDIVLSFGGLVVLSPIYAMIALAIVIDDPGPVLFTQKRMGQNKKYFKLHKFRSMKMSTPHDVPTHMLDNPEQYITKVGKFLRAHSLDELPQIWDIFVGNMSVIGPRPGLWNQDILTAERDKYHANDVKPGLSQFASSRFITCFTHTCQESVPFWMNYGKDVREEKVLLQFRNFANDFTKYVRTDFAKVKDNKFCFFNTPEYSETINKRLIDDVSKYDLRACIDSISLRKYCVLCVEFGILFYKKNINEPEKSDDLLNDWNIYHFHLTKRFREDGFAKRSDYQIFAWVTADCIYMIQIYPHKEAHLYTKKELLKMIEENWPELLKPHHIKGAVRLSVQLDDEQYGVLRDAHATSFVELGENKVCMLGVWCSNFLMAVYKAMTRKA